MTVRCVGCGRSIPLPEDKATHPRLRVKCRCGATFLAAEAPRVDDIAGPAVAAVAPAPVAPAARPPIPPPPPVPRAAAATPAPVAKPVPPPPPIAAGPSAAPAPARPISWRRCVNHAVRSVSVCPACVKGYCEPCASGQSVQNAVICPACDGLCVRAAQYEESQTRGQQQARSLMQELGTIVAYPLRDPIGLVMLALFTWVFAVAAKMALFGGFVGVIFSQGVLLSYCFFAVSRVASGNLRDFTPDFRGISDLTDPLRLGLAVLMISWGPLLAMMFLVPGVSLFGTGVSSGPAIPVVHAQEQPPPSPEAEEAEEPEAGAEQKEDPEAAGSSGEAAEDHEAPPSRAAAAGAVALFALALLWKLIYTPVALTVAALSRSFFKILNPLLGVDTIRKMGGIYWQALVIYSVFAGLQWLLSLALGFIPIAGGIALALVDAYAFLAIGCTLGLAVFKRSKELGWD
jgi:hypothetical protein